MPRNHGSRRRVSKKLRQALARRRWREQEARVVIMALEESGETMARFASEYGLEAERVRRWRVRLEDREAPAVEPRPPAATALYPVRLISPSPQPAESVVDKDKEIGVMLPGGVEVRLGVGFDADALRRLLEVLAC